MNFQSGIDRLDEQTRDLFAGRRRWLGRYWATRDVKSMRLVVWSWASNREVKTFVIDPISQR